MSTPDCMRRRVLWLNLAALICVGAAQRAPADAPAATQAATSAADFDLCVRGSSLEEIHTAHLHLRVMGTDVSAVAPRLGAVLANRNFWNGAAEETFGEPFDADLCGAAVAPELHLTVNLTAEQVAALLAAPAVVQNHTDDSMQSRDVPLFGHPAKPPVLGVPRDIAPNPGVAVTDKEGKLRYHVMRVYYATDRKPVPKAALDPDNFFGGDRATNNDISYGAVNVTLPKNHAIGQLEAPSMWMLEFKSDPDKHVTLQGMQPLDSDAWRAEIAKRATHLGNPGILVFVHGYKNSFADAALKAGQLAYDLKFGGTTVMFSWPSRNEVHGYMADEDAADWATSDMKTVLTSLATLAPDTKIYVVAHSMGNRVFARGFQAMVSENPKLQAPFKEVVMAAPDIDAEVFRRNIGPVILDKGTRFTLYASSKDEALMMSRELHGGYRRLGESGPNIFLMKGIDTVDASTVDTGLVGHSYYGDNGTVMSDMKYVIRQSLPPEKRADNSVLERVNLETVGLYWRFRSIVASTAQ